MVMKNERGRPEGLKDDFRISSFFQGGRGERD